MDRGANGGIISNDARVHHVHLREVDVAGIDNHELNSLKLVDAAKSLTKSCVVWNLLTLRLPWCQSRPFTRLDGLKVRSFA
jgi:hypothetical protein